jgi:hypothetical protein
MQLAEESDELPVVQRLTLPDLLARWSVCRFLYATPPMRSGPSCS